MADNNNATLLIFGPLTDVIGRDGQLQQLHGHQSSLLFRGPTRVAQSAIDLRTLLGRIIDDSLVQHTEEVHNSDAAVMFQ